MGIIVTKNTIRKGVEMARQSLDEGVFNALISSENVLRAKIVKEAPIDTSRLVNSLKNTSGRNVTSGKLTNRLKENLPKGKDVVRFVDNDFKNNKVSLVFGTSVPYSKFVEFGTSRQRANPFFLRGFKNGKAEINNEFAKNLRRKLRSF